MSINTNVRFDALNVTGRKNPYEGLFNGITNAASYASKGGEALRTYADDREEQNKKAQMEQLRKAYEESVNAGNDLNAIKEDRNMFMGGKPTALGLLDHPEIKELMEKSSPKKQMEIAMQMKALGDSTLYDEIVRQQNLDFQREQLNAQTKGDNNEAAIAEAVYQKSLPKMEYDLSMRLSEIDGLLSQDKDANATEEVGKAIKDAIRAGMRQEDVYKLLNSKNEFKEYAKLVGQSRAPKNPPPAESNPFKGR